MLILDAEKSVGIEAIEVFESFLNRKFPKDYKQFLLTYNGGCPVPNCFDFANGQAGSLVQYFMGISPKSHRYDLLKNLRTLEGRIPPHFLPVACDPFGNQICIALNGENYGKIYFWNHEFEADDNDPPTMENVTLIAHNFKDFANSLRNDSGDGE